MDKQIFFYLPHNFISPVGVLNKLFLQMALQDPAFMRDEAVIAGFYGSPMNALWQSGRHWNSPDVNAEDISQQINLFNSYGVSFCFTFSNALLTETDLSDRISNIISEIGNNGMNSFIVNSPILEQYLRECYPNYRFISSVTKCVDGNVDETNRLCEEYDLVVINHFQNHDMEFLKKIKHPDKIKILADSFCSSFCHQSEHHYRLLDISGLEKVDCNIIDPSFQCVTRAEDFFQALHLPDTLSVDEVYGKYADMGFVHHKLEGRTDHVTDVLSSYVYYMIKPEYWNEVYVRMIRLIFDFSVGADGKTAPFTIKA